MTEDVSVENALVDVSQQAGNRAVVMRIPVTVQVVLGQTRMAVSDILALGRGDIIALDRKVGDPVDVVVNGEVVARGQVVVLDDGSNCFGISLTEVVATSTHDQED